METYIWLLVLLLGVLVLMELARIGRGVERTAAMTRRLLSVQGVDWEAPVEPSARVRELALDRKTYVDAIKAYREQTGLGLREARSVIDRLPRRQGDAAAGAIGQHGDC